MPWDCFCPKCSSCCVGGMADDPDDMKKEMEEYIGKYIRCLTCGEIFDFDTHEIMPIEKLFDIIDGLFAYDNGAVDSGIKDDILKSKIFDFLRSQCKEYQMYPDILAKFVKKYYINPPYGLEDVKSFIDWYDRESYGYYNRVG